MHAKRSPEYFQEISEIPPKITRRPYIMYAYNDIARLHKHSLSLLVLDCSIRIH